MSTQRERIATAALQGMLASDAKPQSYTKQQDYALDPGYASALAMDLADALIERLNDRDDPNHQPPEVPTPDSEVK